VKKSFFLLSILLLPMLLCAQEYSLGGSGCGELQLYPMQVIVEKSL